MWKRESAADDEKKKLEEYRKQVLEEREAQELMRVAQEAGHVMCVLRHSSEFTRSSPYYAIAATISQSLARFVAA